MVKGKFGKTSKIFKILWKWLQQVVLFLQTTTLQNTFSYTFIKNQVYYKLEQELLQNGAAYLYYKVGQVLQSRAAISKWGRNYKALHL